MYEILFAWSKNVGGNIQIFFYYCPPNRNDVCVQVFEMQKLGLPFVCAKPLS